MPVPRRCAGGEQELTTSTSENESRNNSENNSNFGALDLLVVAAETWLLLVLVPLAISLVAYFTIVAPPPRYLGSTSFIVNGTQTAPDVRLILDAALGATPSREMTIDSTTRKAALTVVAPTPDEARKGVVSALEALSRNSGLSEEQKKVMTDKLLQNQAQIAMFQTLLEELKAKAMAASTTSGNEQQNGITDAVTAFITVNDRLLQLKALGADIQTSLDSKLVNSPSQDIYVTPTQTPKLVSPVLIGMVAALGIYVLALLRHLWRQISVEASSGSKVERIRKGLRLSWLAKSL